MLTAVISDLFAEKTVIVVQELWSVQMHCPQEVVKAATIRQTVREVARSLHLIVLVLMFQPVIQDTA